MTYTNDTMATRELHFYEMFSYVSPLKPLHMSMLD